MRLHTDRTHAGAAAAMRDGEGLVQVQVADVSADLARFHQTDHRVHVRAVDIDLTTEVMGDLLTYSNKTFTVSSISATGNSRIDSGAILQKIATKPGDLYDPVVLREDIKSVFSMGYFDNVEVEVEDESEGKAVVFRVVEKPLINEVVVTGAAAISFPAVLFAVSSGIFSSSFSKCSSLYSDISCILSSALFSSAVKSKV